MTEYCPEGSLSRFIERRRGKLSMDKKIHILLDIALGMQYLHARNIVHRDLKSDNILIHRSDVAKVADFGISRFVSEALDHTRGVGTARYIAPEVVQGEKYDNKCDVFAFGIIMYEILMETTQPYGSNSYGIEYKVASDADFRPKIPSEMEKTSDVVVARYIELMRKCWAAYPIERPSFTKIISILTEYE